MAGRVLGLLLAALVVFAVLPTGGQARGQAGGQPAPDRIETLRRLALDRVNAERQQRGLPPLTAGAELDRAAQAHADDMATRTYYDHVSPEGEDVMARYRRAGGSRWQLVAENIATCSGCGELGDTVERLHRGWMDSPGHRANILNPGLTQFGFGLAVGSARNRSSRGRPPSLYAVQTFAGPGAPRAAGGAPLGASEQAAAALDLVNEARHRAGVPPLAASPDLSAAATDLLPRSGDLALARDLFEAVPAADRNAWRSLAVVAGSCGGCGEAPVAGDVRFFGESWLGNAQYRRTLLDPAATHLGFALRADGTGRKVGAAVVGRRG